MKNDQNKKRVRRQHSPFISFVVGVAATLILVGSVQAAEIESSIARGGKLYDKWYKVIGAEEPMVSHPLYPADKKYADKPKDNNRCKECHGWDTRGKNGAYASGKHASGIIGINAAANRPVAEIAAIITSASHGYGGKLNSRDVADLALFVSKGQVDMDVYIDRASKSPKGDKERGSAYYNTVCANCHGDDGKLPKEMKPFGAQMSNPWEVMHKILNGQPDEQMPALRAFDHQIIADIMAYMTTLPKK